MKKKLKLILNQDITKNFFILFFGTLLAQLIPILISPILTRIYAVEVFGILALFLSILAIFISISNGKYELVFFSIKSKIARVANLQLSILFTIFISIFIFILLILNIIFDFYTLEYIFLLLPFSILFAGINQAFQYFFNQIGLYKAIAFNKFFIAFFIAIVQVLLGFIFIQFENIGLITGVCIGYFIGLIYFLKVYLRNDTFDLLLKIDFKRVFFVFKKYKNTFHYSLPTAFINSISLNMIVFILGLLYSPVLLGLYFMATRIVNAPLSVFSSAYSNIFNEKISNSTSKQKLYINSFLLNLSVSIIVLTPFLLYGEDIFGFIFGDSWRESGNMIKILAPLIILNFSVGSISGIFSIFLKNEIVFIWQIIYILIIFCLFILFKDDFYNFLKYYSFFGAIAYFVLFLFGLNVIRRI
ncbi:oligosaccharide flippase family protein [Aliarcobacter butzleri]|uniref:Oligosaccharide flippase family protein n=1 Tax=Aliarcobacter butzleri TaxID=28197 RepID=A0AAW7PMV7_9BACT|nr:oligosaccharide flippase family protein [Aliarcobacter butzleri]MDN5062707.1 oligosaccharide flippase family protein [Aliarcobacter butzleri]MDN5065602.1 oligosaccharide flippase family protein [Aliarcobacter butzleri]